LLTEIFHLIFQSCTPHQLLHGLDDNGLKDNQTGQPDTFKRRGRIFAVVSISGNTTQGMIRNDVAYFFYSVMVASVDEV